MVALAVVAAACGRTAEFTGEGVSLRYSRQPGDAFLDDTNRFDTGAGVVAWMESADTEAAHREKGIHDTGGFILAIDVTMTTIMQLTE